MTEVVYAITISGKLKYIGRTNNFRRRQCEHLRNIYNDTGPRRFRRVFARVKSWSDIDFHIVFDGTGKQVRKKERQLILKFRPPANTEFLDPNHEILKAKFAKKK